MEILVSMIMVALISLASMFIYAVRDENCVKGIMNNLLWFGVLLIIILASIAIGVVVGKNQIA